jgi:hypothetical protein
MALTTPEVIALLNKCISLTQPDAVTLANNNEVIAGQFYYLSDERIIICGVSVNRFSRNGEYIAINPDYQNTSGDYYSIWVDSNYYPTVNAGKLYAWDGFMYESLTGVNTLISPDSDPTNWQLVPLTDPRYVTEVDAIIYDVFINAVLERRDKRYNAIKTQATIQYYFRWGDDLVNNNTLEGSCTINLKNLNGTFTNNYIGGAGFLTLGSGFGAPLGINIYSNTINCSVTLEGTAPYIYVFHNCTITYSYSVYPVFLNIEYVRPDGQISQYELKNIEISASSSNYEVGIPISAITGSTLTIPHYAAYGGILYLPSGVTIDTINIENYPYNYYNNYIEVELRAEIGGATTIAPTSKSTTDAYKIMSDNLAPVTISSPMPFMLPPYYANSWEFYRIRNAFNLGNTTPSWHTIMYKQYV